METFRPDESVLSLFDPLAAPRTPPRNTNSPDSATSDKENDGPAQLPGPMTVFFNRIYKDLPLLKGGKAPKGKLVDLGERTPIPPRPEDMLNADNFDGFADEEDAPDLSGTSRRPLADLELEKIARASRRPSTIAEESGDDASVFDAVPSAPSSTPFANVLNSINLSSLSITDFQDPPVASGALACPDITVCPPEANVAMELTPAKLESAADTSCGSSFVFLSPTAYTSTPAIPSPGATRRVPVQTSSADPRRTSVDLQSTFSLHMQSADMSFDLLNDKISFLNASNGSWLIVDADKDDDTFEFAKVNVDEEDTLDLKQAQKRIEGMLQKCEPIREESLDEIVVEIPRVKELTPPKPAPSIDHTLQSVTKAPARTPVFSLPPATKKPAEPAAQPKSLPAPRMVKKTWTAQHERTSTGTSTSSTGSSAAPSSTTSSRRPSVSSSRPTSRASCISPDTLHAAAAPAAKAPARRPSNAATTTPSTTATKPVARGVQRPSAPATAAAPARTAGAARALSSAKPAGAAQRASATAVPSRTLAGPSKPTTTAKTTAPASSTRLQRPAAGVAARRDSVGAGLKPPTEGPRPRSALGSAASGLPRPAASRLPAPTRSVFGGVRRL